MRGSTEARVFNAGVNTSSVVRRSRLATLVVYLMFWPLTNILNSYILSQLDPHPPPRRGPLCALDLELYL